MPNVIRLHHGLPKGAKVNKAVTDLDSAIAKSIDSDKAAGLPQGLIAVELHGHAHTQTHIMVS